MVARIRRHSFIYTGKAHIITFRETSTSRRYPSITYPEPVHTPSSDPHHSPPWSQTHLTSPQARTRHAHRLPPRLLIPPLNLKPLHQSHHHKHALCQRKILPYTRPRAPAERYIRPSGPQRTRRVALIQPPLRSELISVFPIDIGAPMHRPRVKYDVRAFRHQHRREAVFATAAWQDGVAEGLSGVAGHDGIHPLGLVYQCSEVFQIFELMVCGDGGTDDRGDFGTETGEHGGVLGEGPEEVGEEGGGCVAAGEEDVKELGADGGEVMGCKEEGR